MREKHRCWQVLKKKKKKPGGEQREPSLHSSKNVPHRKSGFVWEARGPHHGPLGRTRSMLANVHNGLKAGYCGDCNDLRDDRKINSTCPYILKCPCHQVGCRPPFSFLSLSQLQPKNLPGLRCPVLRNAQLLHFLHVLWYSEVRSAYKHVRGWECRTEQADFQEIYWFNSVPSYTPACPDHGCAYKLDQVCFGASPSPQAHRFCMVCSFLRLKRI